MSISDRLDETIRKVAEVLTAHPSIPNDRQDLTDREYVCPTCGAIALVYGPNSPDHALHQAEQLADAGLIAPAPLREEWAARYTNGGGTVCRTRDEAEAELDRMIRDSRRPRIDEPPAPQIAGIYVRHVTDWETQ